MTCHKPPKMRHVEMHTKTHVAIFFSCLGNADVVLYWYTSSRKSATYTKRAGRRLTPISGQSRTSPRACLDLNPNPMSSPKLRCVCFAVLPYCMRIRNLQGWAQTLHQTRMCTMDIRRFGFKDVQSTSLYPNCLSQTCTTSRQLRQSVPSFFW